MAVSKRVRFEVFKRDLFFCQYCGKRPPEVVLEVDHVVPRCEGGPDDITNLTTACLSCNRGKAGVPLGQVAPALDELEVMAAIQEMAERRIGLKQQTLAADATRKAEDEAIETVWDWWCAAFGPDDGAFSEASIRRFLKEITLTDIAKATDNTEVLVGRKPWTSSLQRWKYFCGACWGIIKEAR